MEKSIIFNLTEALLDNDFPKCKDIISNLKLKSASFLDFEVILEKSLEAIGKEWENGNASISQVYMSGKILEQLSETLFEERTIGNPQNKKIAMVVLEDFHVLGKKIVLSILRSAGFST